MAAPEYTFLDWEGVMLHRDSNGADRDFCSRAWLCIGTLLLRGAFILVCLGMIPNLHLMFTSFK